MQLQTSLEIIQLEAVAKEEENVRFAAFLKQQTEQQVDEKVQHLNLLIEKEIDCTACGNCCKTLMINVTDNEADRAAGRLKLNRDEFDRRHLEKGSHGMMLINTIPCHFLNENKCTIYEDRFEGCREFPALHLPSFVKRLFTVLMHYNRCPIIFNVVEELKKETGFSN